MKQYERYKDSGVEWLGRAPEHWRQFTIRAFTRLKSDKGHPNYEVLSVYREYGVVKKDSRDDNHNATSQETITYKAVYPTDLVINKMKAWQGSMGISSYKGIVSPAYITCELNKEVIHCDYLHYLLRSSRYIDEYNRLSYGVRIGQWDMHYEDFKQIIVNLPTVSEQKAIAHFLDQKSAQVDKAISQKEKVIELLNERRQIIIQRAVMCGLDPNVPMKDSGVYWIGKIPEHWEVKRIKNIGVCRNGLTYSPNDICSNREGTLVLRSSNISDSKLVLTDNVYVKSKIPNELLVKKGDILICSRNGSANLVGKLAIIDSSLKATFGAFMMIFRSSYPSNYISYILEVTMKRYMGEFSTSTINQLTLSIFSKMFVPFIDDLNEQQQIATYLDQVNAKIDKAISIKRQEIEKLKEYKTVLIDAAVTGKIKIA